VDSVSPHPKEIKKSEAQLPLEGVKFGGDEIKMFAFMIPLYRVLQNELYNLESLHKFIQRGRVMCEAERDTKHCSSHMTKPS
jgi:hypothetical protein